MNKVVAIMQPYFMPYIGYWQVLNAVDEYVIYDDAQYMQQSYINRNNILLSNNLHRFSIILNGASPNKQIKEVAIGDNFINFLKTIKMAYRRAPYFEDTYAVLEKVCSYNDRNLASFLKNIIQVVCDYLDIRTKIIMSSTIDKTGLNRNEKIFKICNSLNATNYVNAIGGKELYNKEDFTREGIVLNFLKTRPLAYKQFNDNFIPNLSIIDIMMFNSPSEIKNMLQEYDLI